MVGSLTLYLVEKPFNTCKQSRPRSGSSCKSCLIRVYSVCLWKYDISDPTLLDVTRNFYSMYKRESLFIKLFIVAGV